MTQPSFRVKDEKIFQVIEKPNENFVISWPDFVRIWLDLDNELLYNHHWHTTIWSCLPCGYEYDYILKTETAHEDSKKLVDLIFPHFSEKRRSELVIPARDVEHQGTKMTAEEQKKGIELPEDLKERLRERLYWDLKMFGYTY